VFRLHSFDVISYRPRAGRSPQGGFLTTAGRASPSAVAGILGARARHVGLVTYSGRTPYSHSAWLRPDRTGWKRDRFTARIETFDFFVMDITDLTEERRIELLYGQKAD